MRACSGFFIYWVRNKAVNLSTQELTAFYMRITTEALKEFEEIYSKDHPGESLSKEELLEMATRVLNVLEIIYKPIKK